MADPEPMNLKVQSESCLTRAFLACARFRTSVDAGDRTIEPASPG
jgi:hypothetical protein